jgi:uncharacterized phage-associated protein
MTNYRKFVELLVYVLSQFDEPINETKMLKLLYFADANSYEKLGKTISDVTYYKNHFGPTPNCKILMSIYEALDQYLERAEQQRDDYKSCLVRLRNRSYTFKSLSAEEMEIIDEAVTKYGKLSLSEVVKLSHFDPPYLASQKKKKIDFSYVRFRKSDEDYETNLDQEARDAIAKDISTESRRRLKIYAGARA